MELFGQEGEQGFVGFAFHSGRVNFHFQGFAMLADDLASACIGHDADAQKRAQALGLT